MFVRAFVTIVTVSASLILTLAQPSTASASVSEEFREALRRNPNATPEQVCNLLRSNLRHSGQLFAEGTVDQPPKGDTFGCVIGLTKLPSFMSHKVAMIMNHFWTGKKFNEEGTALVNKVPVLSPIGLEETATAKVYRTQSVVDGRDIYVLDYSESQQNLPIEQWGIRIIRDEIRELSPGIYMGPVFMDMFGIPLPTTLYFAVFTQQSGLLK